MKMKTIQTQSNQIQKRMSLPSFHLAIEIEKNCIYCFRFCKTFVGVERCIMLAFG